MSDHTMLDISPEEVQRILETQTKHMAPPGHGGETILGVPKDVFLAHHAPLKWKTCVDVGKAYATSEPGLGI